MKASLIDLTYNSYVFACFHGNKSWCFNCDFTAIKPCPVWSLHARNKFVGHCQGSLKQQSISLKSKVYSPPLGFALRPAFVKGFRNPILYEELYRISSELSRKVRVSKESLILRLGGQVSSIFKLKWVGEVKLCRKNAFHDCSIA